jgi:hypothetical protein
MPPKTAAAAALAACAGALAVLAAAKEPATPPLDSPRWAALGYSELVLGVYPSLPENDFVNRAVLPRFAARPGDDVAAAMAVADVVGDGQYAVFVRLSDPKWCDDGCRTLAYKWLRGRWRLVADGPAVSVEALTPTPARRGGFAFVTRSHGTLTWRWDGTAFAPTRLP